MCSFKGDDSMGKKSLIKSTTKKRTTKSAKKPAATTKKKGAAAATKKSGTAAAKKKAAPTAKKAATKKPAPKKTTAKKTTAAKSKAAPKKTKTPKKVSVKELVFKKFEPFKALPEVMPAPKPAAVDVSAPPFVSSSDPKEVERIRALLFQRFDMDAIKAAAKAPAPVVEPAPAPEPEAAATAPAQSAEIKETAAAEAEKPVPDGAYITVEPPASEGADEPMSRAVKIALGAAATIIFLLLATSYNNSSKYYIYPQDNAIEIWKGRFSPKDKAFFMVLHGTPVEEPLKETYTEKEVFPLVFNYYVDKADTLLEVPGLPDFEGIKTYLHQAEDYIVSNEMQTAVTTRLNTIERMILLYKADVALSKDTDEALQSAITLLKKAAKLTPSTAQAEEIAKKIEQARARRTALKSAAE
jgi:hypothetical protein